MILERHTEEESRTRFTIFLSAMRVVVFAFTNFNSGFFSQPLFCASGALAPFATPSCILIEVKMEPLFI